MNNVQAAGTTEAGIAFEERRQAVDTTTGGMTTATDWVGSGGML